MPDLERDIVKEHKKEIIKGLIIFGLILIVIRRMDIKHIKDCLVNTNKFMILLALIIVCLMCLTLAIKWKILLKNLQLMQLIKGVLVAHIVTYSLGGQLLGEGSKLLAMKNTKEQLEKVTASILLDKITGLIGVFIVGLFGMFFSRVPLANEYKVLYCLTVGGSIFLFSFFLNCKIIKLIKNCSQKLIKKSGFLEKLGVFFANISIAIEQFINEWKRVALSVGAGIIVQIISISISFIICYAIGIKVDFWGLCWIISLISVISLIPLSVMGIGINQISTIGILAMVGVAKEKAAAYTVVTYIIMVGVALLAGIFLMICSIYEKRRER